MAAVINQYGLVVSKKDGRRTNGLWFYPEVRITKIVMLIHALQQDPNQVFAILR